MATLKFKPRDNETSAPRLTTWFREFAVNSLPVSRATGGVDKIGRALSQDVSDMDIRYFDITTTNGRVYRVRVSDITPEGE